IDGSFPSIHPDGNVIRRQRVIRGDQNFVGEVVVEGTYEIGMQDQAFLGLEAALALPDDDGGGIELFVATQWLHEDQKQIAACLDVPVERVRLTLGGVGGAFGGREDISLQVHCCLLALVTKRPIKMQYGREESFYGHIHRHPAKIFMRHHADRDGTLRRVEARVVLDGGAYASTSSAVLINAVTHMQGPYKCEIATVDGYAVRSNNPPCGAMRGFGVVQACFAHESQMDKLGDACGLSHIDIRLKNAMQTGDRLITGQVVESVAPVARCIRETAALPMPSPLPDDPDPLLIPGGAGLTARRSNIRRGVGWGVSIKNLMYSEGFDDYATARCRLADGIATLQFATAEVGQGF
ncbi:MAG: molybdopterin cofactor-binding domain-containing protein, partial [Actinomycetota bacterium]